MSEAWRQWSNAHVAGIRERSRVRSAAAAGDDAKADETSVPGHLRGTKREPLAVMAEALSFRPAFPPGRAR